MFYKDKKDLAAHKLSDERDVPSSRRERRREERDGRRGDRDGGRDRGGKPRRKNDNMTRFFFNLGKKDNLKKVDMLDIINKATKKARKRPDIGDIEILEKFSFFEVEKDFKNEILNNLSSMKFKGKEMRAEEAN